jgi:hypothetical protein
VLRNRIGFPSASNKRNSRSNHARRDTIFPSDVFGEVKMLKFQSLYYKSFCAIALTIGLSAAASAKILCFEVDPGPGGPGTVLYKQPVLYLQPGAENFLSAGNGWTKLDTSAASSLIWDLAAFETMRANGAGKTALNGVQQMGAVTGGIKRLDSVMPDLVDQLKLGKSSIQLEVK